MCMILPVETMTDFIRRNESTLVECLDTENGFANCLLSKGVLNAEQHSRIINRTLYPLYRDQNKALLDMLLPILITESSCNSFMEALIDTNQRHVFNFISSTPKYILCLNFRITTAIILHLRMISGMKYSYYLQRFSARREYVNSLLGQPLYNSFHIQNLIEAWASILDIVQ